MYKVRLNLISLNRNSIQPKIIWGQTMSIVKNTACWITFIFTFCCLLLFVFELTISKFFIASISVSNGLDPDQYGLSVSPVLGRNCLQTLSAGDKSPLARVYNILGPKFRRTTPRLECASILHGNI